MVSAMYSAMNFNKYNMCYSAFLVAAVVVVSSQSIHLVPDRNLVCPGEPVELTCIAFVRGLLSWFSDCYIGDGGQSIAFFSNTPNGTRKNSTADQDVFAVLNSIYNVGALPELNSSLYIETVKEEPCTIICNTSDGLQMNITIQKLGCPGELRNCAAVSTTNSVISISCESLPLGPEDRYLVKINGTMSITNHTADSTVIEITVNCSSTYSICIAAVNHCGLKSPWVYVGTMNTGVCERPSNAMAVHAGNAYIVVIGFAVSMLAIWIMTAAGGRMLLSDGVLSEPPQVYKHFLN